jgi:hypothetical protein
MRSRLLMIVVAAAAVVAVVAVVPLFVPRTAGQAQRAARIDGHPNFSGIWQALNEADWDLEAHHAFPGFVWQEGVHPLALVPAAPALPLGTIGAVPGSIGVVEGGTIPYAPEALKQKMDNKANWLDRDPEVRCLVGGIPRSMYMPYPFEIIQSANRVEMVFSYANTGRTIYLDKVEPPPIDTGMGFSMGRWEGDTLVTDVTGFISETWLSRAGDWHSDALRVTERLTPAGNLNDMFALWYEATIEDPKVFTRPWKIRMPLYRRIEPNAQLMEFRCHEFLEELIFGHLRRQQLVKTWSGTTFDVNIVRKVPSDEGVLYQRFWDASKPSVTRCDGKPCGGP